MRLVIVIELIEENIDVAWIDEATLRNLVQYRGVMGKLERFHYELTDYKENKNIPVVQNSVPSEEIPKNENQI